MLNNDGLLILLAISFIAYFFIIHFFSRVISINWGQQLTVCVIAIVLSYVLDNIFAETEWAFICAGVSASALIITIVYFVCDLKEMSIE